MENTDVGAGPSGPVMSPRIASLPEGARLSLEAIRVAQEAARARARRQTMHTRIWFAVSLAAVTLVAFAMGPRVSRWAHARARKVMPARPVAVSPAPVTPAPASNASFAAATAISVAPKPEPVDRPAMERPAPEPSAIAALAKAHAVAAAAAAAADRGCDTSLIRSAPWRLSPEACAREFDADPTNARLALAIAHAEHVRGHGADAAQWAKRALSLDPNVAEAYILIARASAEGGRPEDAHAAYQRYLELAPRGWHQAEARNGGRGARAR